MRITGYCLFNPLNLITQMSAILPYKAKRLHAGYPAVPFGFQSSAVVFHCLLKLVSPVYS